MVTTEELGEIFRNFMSNTFGIPADWFQFPQIIFYFLIPLLGLLFVWYTFLYKRLGLFRNSEFANFMLALLISFMSSAIIRFLTPTFTLAIAIGAGVLLWGRFSLLRIILAGAVAWGLTFLYPLLTNFVLVAFPT